MLVPDGATGQALTELPKRDPLGMLWSTKPTTGIQHPAHQPAAPATRPHQAAALPGLTVPADAQLPAPPHVPRTFPAPNRGGQRSWWSLLAAPRTCEGDRGAAWRMPSCQGTRTEHTVTSRLARDEKQQWRPRAVIRIVPADSLRAETLSPSGKQA